MGVPTVERPPPGLDAYWLGAWRAALKQLKEQRSWVPASKPLLDEYIYALMEAAEARAQGESGPFDKHSKRGLAFAEALGLTAHSRRKLGVKREAADGDEDEGLAELYEFAPRSRSA